jgi:transposase
MPGSRRRKFDQDFTGGAVRLVCETGRPIARIAKDLGINAGTVGNWVVLDRQGKNGGGRLDEDERVELARLRRENAELAMERDVLKRSAALKRLDRSRFLGDEQPPHQPRQPLCRICA